MTYLKYRANWNDSFWHVMAYSLMLQLHRLDETEAITAGQSCPDSTWKEAADYLDKLVNQVKHDQWHAELDAIRDARDKAATQRDCITLGV